MDVFIDSCAANRFALAGVDLAIELADSEFSLSATPYLLTGYQQAIDHPDVAPSVRKLAGNLLKNAHLRGYFGFGGAPCAGFGKGSFISNDGAKLIDSIPTRDERQIQKWGQESPGFIAWPELEADLKSSMSFISCLRNKSISCLPNKSAKLFP